MSNHKDKLLQKIGSSEAIVGVIGLGYVGLPVAMAFARKGFRVLGFDVDETKIEAIGAGRNYIRHLVGESLGTLVDAGRLSATADFKRLGEPDAIIICVPTPLSAHREPDLSFVRQTVEAISKTLRAGQLIILESTTYPGTTDQLVAGILDGGGLQLGDGYFLAFSPEREDPGNRDFSTTSIPKVVGGVEVHSGDLAEALYAAAIETVVRVRDSRVAEASKLTENVFRAVNIALVNELKVIYQRMGIDIWEVLDAAATKPFGFMRFDPGPGWGGHCIPLDPFYLTWKAREFGMTARFIELAGEINVQMPAYVVARLQGALNDRGKALKGSRVLVLGLAYKRDIGDTRESPAFELIDRLLQLEAAVEYHDPYVPTAPKVRSWPHLPPMESTPLTEGVLRAVDAVVIVTDHGTVDYDLVAQVADLVVDTRGVLSPDCPRVVRA